MVTNRSLHSMRVFWSVEDEAFIAVCPELGELSAFGPTADEAVRELQVAIELAIQVLEEDGESIPAAVVQQEYSGQFRVRLPKSLHAQLVRDAETDGVSLNALVISRLAAVTSVEGTNSAFRDLSLQLNQLQNQIADLAAARSRSSRIRPGATAFVGGQYSQVSASASEKGATPEWQN